MGKAKKNYIDNKLKSVNIIVYEGTLPEFRKSNTPKAQNYIVSAQNNDEAIGAVATHESFHATDPVNIKKCEEKYKHEKEGKKYTSHDTELIPEEVEKNVLRELFNQHNQIKPIGHE